MPRFLGLSWALFQQVQPNIKTALHELVGLLSKARAGHPTTPVYAMNQTSNVPPVITKVYDVLEWLLPQIEKFPRAHRYVLGKRLEEQLYELLDLTIDAAYTRDKRRILIQANLLLEKLRYTVRLCKDMKFINFKKYEYLSRQFVEIGKMIGGWIKNQTK